MCLFCSDRLAVSRNDTGPEIGSSHGAPAGFDSEIKSKAFPLMNAGFLLDFFVASSRSSAHMKELSLKSIVTPCLFAMAHYNIVVCIDVKMNSSINRKCVYLSLHTYNRWYHCSHLPKKVLENVQLSEPNLDQMTTPGTHQEIHIHWD